VKALVVDDEAPARAKLVRLLGDDGRFELAGEAGDGLAAVDQIEALRPDLLLLDIQMPKLDGFDVLELIGADVPVIFTTAYDQYAIKAFQVHAVDYLLKPFGAERLAEALARARSRIAVRETLPAKALVADARAARSPIERILIRDKADVHVIPVAKIDYIESQDDYVSLKVGDRSLLKEQTLSELEQLLDPGRFVRIHRRYLLNVSRLARIEQSVTDSRVAVLQDGSELPISRSGYAKLREIL